MLTVLKVYREVKEVLHPWPHLLILFTEFLTAEDCVQVDAVSSGSMPESIYLNSIPGSSRFHTGGSIPGSSGFHTSTGVQ